MLKVNYLPEKCWGFFLNIRIFRSGKKQQLIILRVRHLKIVVKIWPVKLDHNSCSIFWPRFRSSEKWRKNVSKRELMALCVCVCFLTLDIHIIYIFLYIIYKCSFYVKLYFKCSLAPKPMAFQVKLYVKLNPNLSYLLTRISWLVSPAGVLSNKKNSLIPLREI